MSFGTIQLNDGHEIPAIAFGTGSVWKGKDVTEYVEQAIECGYSHIDTAAIYQTETGVALAIRESGLDRSDLYVTTKYDGGGVQAAIRDSLQRLGLKQVDLYLIHAPVFAPNVGETWLEMEKVKESGLAKSIGVSNFTVEHLQQVMKVAKVVPAVNQIRLHPYNYSEMKETIAYCSKHGIIIEAYNSLAPITEFPGGAVDAPIAVAAERLGASPTQVLLSWVKQKGAVIVTTSSKSAHLEEYLAVAKLGSLTQEEIAAYRRSRCQRPSSSTFAQGYAILASYTPCSSSSSLPSLHAHASKPLLKSAGFWSSSGNMVSFICCDLDSNLEYSNSIETVIEHALFYKATLIDTKSGVQAFGLDICSVFVFPGVKPDRETRYPENKISQLWPEMGICT